MQKLQLAKCGILYTKVSTEEDAKILYVKEVHAMLLIQRRKLIHTTLLGIQERRPKLSSRGSISISIWISISTTASTASSTTPSSTTATVKRFRWRNCIITLRLEIRVALHDTR